MKKKLINLTKLKQKKKWKKKEIYLVWRKLDVRMG
jgi:hypothetical protein